MKNMNSSKAILSFLFSVLTAIILGGAIGSFADVSPFIAIPSTFAFGVITGLVPMPTGVAFMAIQQEIWVNYIIDNLFKDNSVLTKCFDESEYVLNGAVVHIPQAGAKPTVVKNRSSFPAVAVRRTDTDITYALDVYSTDPLHITNAEQKEISYDKVGSALGEHPLALEEEITEQALYKWCATASGSIIRTTGATVATSLSTGATGTRKALLKEDLKKAASILTKQGIAKADRYALIPSDMMEELTSDADLMKRDGVAGGELDVKNGVVMRLYGFNIMERATNVVYDNTGTPVPKAPGAASAATDNQSVLCWQKNAVAKALGSTKFFENLNDALYYGDVYSAEVKFGGRKRRTNGEGVVQIVQALVS